MPRKYDYLIVGSGLFGATFAHLAHRDGKKCLVIEKRSHLGGNVYCEEVEGIHVHKYGAHIFHTNNREIWDFVNGIVPFNRYTNCPVANYKGKLYNLPFNMNTFYQMWGVTTPEQAAAKIEEQKAEAVARMRAEGVSEPRNLEEQALTLVGNDIYEKLIKGYTEKQWGRPCTELPAFIIKRLPVRLVFDNNYFNDAFQGIPVGGYNKLVEGLLEGVECRVDTDFFTDRDRWMSAAEKVIFTGPIDAFYDFRFGRLEWRTVRFEQEVLDTPNFQGNAVVNYTDAETPFTRIIEHKHFEFAHRYHADGSLLTPEEEAADPKTIIYREYSVEWKIGDEPYYPVNDDVNNALYAKYKALADQEKNVIFGGRLGEYKYYDMDVVIKVALEKVQEVISAG